MGTLAERGAGKLAPQRFIIDTHTAYNGESTRLDLLYGWGA